MRNNQDWSPVDLETLPVDWIPATSYKPAGDRARYDAAYTSWEVPDEDGVLRTVRARDCYRVAWRAMAANTGERTLIPTIIPPGSSHVDGIFSACLPTGTPTDLATAAGILGSLVSDFAIRAAPKKHIRAGTAGRLPDIKFEPMKIAIAQRVIQLVCVTDTYSDFWTAVSRRCAGRNGWIGVPADKLFPLNGSGDSGWSFESALRIARTRRQAQLEIDALVALGLGLSADELCTIYRTQFPVLYGYDRKTYLYDSNGRLVPQFVLVEWRKKGDALTVDQRTATNASGNTYVYELPFQFLDREKDMREAYAEFERRFDIVGGTPPEAKRSTTAESR